MDPEYQKQLLWESRQRFKDYMKGNHPSWRPQTASWEAQSSYSWRPEAASGAFHQDMIGSVNWQTQNWQGNWQQQWEDQGEDPFGSALVQPPS